MARQRKPDFFLDSEHIGVSGERYYDKGIQEILSRHADGRLEYRCNAIIKRDLLNDRDPHAVEVIVHGIRVGYIARATSEMVASKIGDSEVELKCVIHWNGEALNGIYHVKLFPIF